MQRVAVLGTSGAGKSTMAARLAEVIGCPFIEPDALYWGPGWAAATRDEFRARVAAAVAGERWTFGGNYSSARDIVWPRADTLVWLDYPLPLVMARLLRRTVRRILTREELWAGNRETWRDSFLSRESVLLLALRTHARRRASLPAELARPEHAHLAVRRFRRPRDADAWLARVRAGGPP